MWRPYPPDKAKKHGALRDIEGEEPLRVRCRREGSGATMISDNDIIRRVQQGERELFGELHARYHERIYHHVARSIFEREAAQDVACETWLRAYAAVDRFEPRSDYSVPAWLLRIATNLVTDYRRRLPSVEWTDEIEQEPMLRLMSPAAESEVMRREQSLAVRRALGTLSDGDRQIIHLAHQDDLNCQEIASILGKPSVSAVTSHLYRAMQHLKRALEASGWFPEYAPEHAHATNHARATIREKRA